MSKLRALFLGPLYYLNLKGGEKMRFIVNITGEDLLKLQELEKVTGIEKSTIISILIDEVFSGYKCSKMSRDPDYMLFQLTTEKFKKNIRSKK